MFKRKAGLDYRDKSSWVIGSILLFQTVIPKNKAVLSLNNIVCAARWYLVTYSNCFVI